MKTNRYAIYARYSTDRQSESSIEDQVRRCTEHVRDRGGEVVAVYKDEAVSGARFRSRPAVQRMLMDAEQARRRPFDFVVVHKHAGEIGCPIKGVGCAGVDRLIILFPCQLRGVKVNAVLHMVVGISHAKFDQFTLFDMQMGAGACTIK